MGYEMTKALANSDVDYWRQMPKKASHQSAIFIGSAQGEKVCGLLGEAKTGDAVSIVLNRSNLIRVLTAHYEVKDRFFSSRNLGQWTITIEYLKQCLEKILMVFRTEEEVFIASVNRQTSAQNCRAWIKGLQPELKREDGTCGINVFDYLFSGDSLHFTRDDEGLVHIDIIPKVATPFVGEDKRGLLRVGDSFGGKGDEKYTVIDVMSRAYRIRVEKTGKIRTVPKSVVSAWYKFYKEHPYVDYDVPKKNGVVEHKTHIPIREANVRSLRDQYLNTSTEDDPFEHAYDGMLGNIARWLLDHPREEDQEPEAVAGLPSADLLSVALKMFAEKRKEEEWCSDKTDGDANKPRIGYVVNKMRRGVPTATPAVAQLQHGSAAQIRDWFKSANDPNSLKSVVDAVEEGDVATFGPYLANLIQPQAPAPTRPPKFTRALESIARNMIAPDKFGAYDEHAHKALSSLGLIDFPFNEDFTDLDYDDVLHAQRVIMRRLVEMKTPQVMEFGKAYSPSDPDWKDADYLTVYEFLWFVNENFGKIEKQVLEGKMVAAKHEGISPAEKAKKPKCDMSSHDDVLLLRLRAALRTKPFAILAGHSGTGKSRMVRKLAYMTCNDAALRKDEKGNPAKDPGNFCMVQVKPNWHDSGDLLGYYSELGKRYRASDFVKFIVKAYAYPDTPFFVCLDEMNLAPVEQYFAEYLSAIESRKIQGVKVLKGTPLAEADVKTVVSDELIPRSAYVEGEEANRVIHYDWLGCELKESEHWIANYGVTIPRNLFVVGTVNMDESTNQFSRKVLDRAMTLEMTDADFNSFGKKGVEPSYDDYMGDDAVAELLAGKIQSEKLEKDQIQNLNALKAVLGSTSFAVAYRFANEYALYEESLKETQAKTDSTSVPAPVAGAPAPAPAAPAVQAAAPATPPADGETAAPAPAEAVAAIPAKPLAFDDMILMKVLPRISGEDVAVRRIFFGESGKFSDPKPGSLLELVRKGGTDTESVRKIKAIDERGGAYLSFWP